MVIHKIHPSIADSMAKRRPPKIIQRILSKTDPAPPPNCTSFPNGKKARPANLKHCIPMGIPTMVMHHTTPTSTQLRPCHMPPNRNHSAFPKQPKLPPSFPGYRRYQYLFVDLLFIEKAVDDLLFRLGFIGELVQIFRISLGWDILFPNNAIYLRHGI